MVEEKRWKLGEDIDRYDNLLDSISFDELIVTVHCNCREITQEAVEKELNRIFAIRIQDMQCLLEKNIDEIIAEAKKGRES
ncbi:hypothetical protein EDD74_11938 [Faecalimonas umbilicata]|uniref:Uncharacterized protein n=1 Tax=Faecalimonas umbilicata TaxID=1912855 RepID=A0A4R3JIU7_9FIRM|nr:hypothetical protein [Faecalimonas umbilicata]TCS66140.1 hypothetical protein EDD74_11938 [Faecalimonas umbilicata]GBU06540.1 hypothetical protein FAEUMB_30810 [Faecalimonas umbilicata]